MSAPETPNPENPFEWVIETVYAKKSKGTREVVMLSLLGEVGPNGDGAEVALKPWLEEHNLEPQDLTVDLAYKYLQDLRSAYSPGTQDTRANYCSKAYTILNNKNVEGFDYDPIGHVLEEYDVLDDITQKSATIYTKDQIIDVIREQHPVNQTVSMTMLKTARRIGGVLNLDFKDIHIDHPAANWEVHSEIRDKPDHIHFSPGVSQGEEYRGESRHDGQKTKTRVTVPMDQELKDHLIWYLSFRRSNKQEGPFFINPRGVDHNQRLKSPAYRDWLTPIAKEKGLFFGKGDPDNIRPHYWRHWTTTKMRDRLDSDVVDYFRGDKGAVGDLYNHYTEEKAIMWRQEIPKFYEPYKNSIDN